VKALKSDLAKALLADPRAKEKLRTFLTTRASAGSAPTADVLIEVQDQGKKVRVTPTVVPKAT